MNKQRPLVSIAMCTYNGSRFLEEQLISLVQQSYSNIEIIITDDGSSDDTVDMIKRYMAQYSNIKLSENETNLGFVKNFEKAISLCRGEYIALADQDDIWKLHKIETFVNAIGTHSLIYSDAELIDADSNMTGSFLIQPKKSLLKGPCASAFIFDNCVSGNTLMFQRALLDHVLPIPDEVRFHDQWIAFVAATYGAITYTDEAMTKYRRYADQVTHVTKAKAKGFIQRLEEKKKRKMWFAQNRYEHIQTFLQLDNEPSVNELLIQLLEHYKNFETCFYNVPLLKKVWKERDQLFAMEPCGRKRAIQTIKTAIGLRLYRMTLFTI